MRTHRPILFLFLTFLFLTCSFPVQARAGIITDLLESESFFGTIKNFFDGSQSFFSPVAHKETETDTAEDVEEEDQLKKDLTADPNFSTFFSNSKKIEFGAGKSTFFFNIYEEKKMSPSSSKGKLTLDSPDFSERFGQLFVLDRLFRGASNGILDDDATTLQNIFILDQLF